MHRGGKATSIDNVRTIRRSIDVDAGSRRSSDIISPGDLSAAVKNLEEGVFEMYSTSKSASRGTSPACTPTERTAASSRANREPFKKALSEGGQGSSFSSTDTESCPSTPSTPAPETNVFKRNLVDEVTSQIVQEVLPGSLGTWLATLSTPLGVHKAVPEAMAVVWMVMRETMVSEGVWPPDIKEILAVVVSENNRCPFCRNGHSMMASIAGANAADVMQQMKQGKPENIKDPLTRKVVEWGNAVTLKGLTTSVIDREFKWTQEERAELVGVVFFKCYMNRITSSILGSEMLSNVLELPSRMNGALSKLVGSVGRSVENTKVRCILLPTKPLVGALPLRTRSWDFIRMFHTAPSTLGSMLYPRSMHCGRWRRTTPCLH